MREGGGKEGGRKMVGCGKEVGGRSGVGCYLHLDWMTKANQR